jgi:hypothetical protein
MKKSTRPHNFNKNTGIKDPGHIGYEPVQWLRCHLGIHCGTWTYTTMGNCAQERSCTNCGRRQTRVKHVWDHRRDYSTEGRECTRCKKIERWGTTREDLIMGLYMAGVSATLAQRGRPEEGTGRGSMGLIDIARSPISWINVRKWDNEGPVYATDYGVPDPRPLPYIKIKSVRVRTFPLFGNVIDVRWKGNGPVSSLLQNITADRAIRAAIMANRDEIVVSTCPELRCWLIPRMTKDAPLASQWDCFQRIASTLLVSPLM